MKSYAVIDRFEGDYAVLEVELIETEYSRPEDFAIKDTEMIDLDLDYIRGRVGQVEESDVLVVEHSCDGISDVLYIDYNEKIRRIELLTRI